VTPLAIMKGTARRSTDIFAFLTCEPNAEVARVHPKAML